MYCPQCGAYNDDKAVKCSRCDAAIMGITESASKYGRQQQAVPPPPGAPKPPPQPGAPAPPSPVQPPNVGPSTQYPRIGPPPPGTPAGPPPGAPMPNIPNYLVHSILVTLFCCMPFGIAAIISAASVNTKLGARDYNGALEASNKAKMWCWVGFGCGAVVQLGYLAFVIFAMFLENQ